MEKTLAIYLGEELTEDQDKAILEELKALENKHPVLQDMLSHDGFFSIYTEWNSPGIDFPERFPARPAEAKDALVFIVNEVDPIRDAIERVAKQVGLRIVGYDGRVRTTSVLHWLGIQAEYLDTQRVKVSCRTKSYVRSLAELDELCCKLYADADPFVMGKPKSSNRFMNTVEQFSEV